MIRAVLNTWMIHRIIHSNCELWLASISGSFPVVLALESTAQFCLNSVLLPHSAIVTPTPLIAIKCWLVFYIYLVPFIMRGQGFIVFMWEELSCFELIYTRNSGFLIFILFCNLFCPLSSLFSALLVSNRGTFFSCGELETRVVSRQHTF